MITIRENRYGVDERLQTTFTVKGRGELLGQINNQLRWMDVNVYDEHLTITPCASDTCVAGWKEAHVIHVRGIGVYGFSSGPVL